MICTVEERGRAWATDVYETWCMASSWGSRFGHPSSQPFTPAGRDRGVWGIPAKGPTTARASCFEASLRRSINA